jgi:hypothetical protein
MGFHGDFMVTLMGYDMIYPPVSSNIAMGISPIIRHFKEKKHRTKWGVFSQQTMFDCQRVK